MGLSENEIELFKQAVSVYLRENAVCDIKGVFSLYVKFPVADAHNEYDYMGRISFSVDVEGKKPWYKSGELRPLFTSGVSDSSLVKFIYLLSMHKPQVIMGNSKAASYKVVCDFDYKEDCEISNINLVGEEI